MIQRAIWLGGAAAVLIAGTAAVVAAQPADLVKTGAGMTAHNLCAAAFTQGVDPDATFRELVKPMVGPAAGLITYTVDRPAKAVEARLLGVTARAVWTQGYGCRLVIDPKYPLPTPVAPRPASAPDGFAPPVVVAPADARLAAALDTLFTDPPGAPRYVKAVLIVKDGKVVAERYAPGFGVDTPLLSYSVAKSFTATFLGVLVRQGRLRADQPVGAPEWAGGDPRAALTLDDLLRMQSGTSAREDGSGLDAASQMLYAHDDMAAYAASFPLRAKPRTEWDYTSANTLVLDRVLGASVGGAAAGFRAFADREVFAPLHMDGVTLEFDGTGVFSGSAHVYAPARAFARLGLMYANGGVGPDGRRILPIGWDAYVRKSTLGAPYGAGFWTLDGPSQDAASLVAQGFPKDGYFASGNRGQRIYIVPSRHLVMVRFGYTASHNFDIGADLKVLSTALAVLN